MSPVREIKMEDLPEDLHAIIHDFRPVHPCARMIASFLDRISTGGATSGTTRVYTAVAGDLLNNSNDLIA